MEVIGELFIAILAGIVELIIMLLGLVFSQSWLATRRDGLRRWGHILALTMAAFLLFGMIRPVFPVLWTPALTPLYQWQIIVVAIVLLLVGLSIGEFARRSHIPEQAAKEDTESETAHSSGYIAAMVLVIALIGVASLITSKRHETSLADRLCAQADARISDSLEGTVRDGAGLLDRVLGTQTADRIPCADD